MQGGVISLRGELYPRSALCLPTDVGFFEKITKFIQAVKMNELYLIKNILSVDFCLLRFLYQGSNLDS